MGDRVQQELEGFLDELEDLVDRNLFTADEVRSIVAKRRDFEYLLQRRAPRKEDFLRYIEYEMQLDKLRVKRKRRKGVKATGVADKRNRIHILFTRALRRFRGDMDLWHNAIAYGRKTKSAQATEKRLGEAMRLHPRHVPFWLEAARFHLEDNSDVGTARTLLQTGLRANKDSPKLWAETVRLEALHIFQIRQRRVVLGIDDENGRPTDETREAEANEQAEQARAEAAARDEVIFKGKVLQIVYQRAVEALPESLELRELIVASLEPFFGTVIGDLVLELARQLWADATTGPKAPKSCAELCWEARAAFELKHGGHSTPADAEAHCVRLLQQGLAALETPRMCRVLAEFLSGRLANAAESGDDDLPDVEVTAPQLRSSRRKRQRAEPGAIPASRSGNLRGLLEDLATGKYAALLDEPTLLLIAQDNQSQPDVIRTCLALAPWSPRLCRLAIQSASAAYRTEFAETKSAFEKADLGRDAEKAAQMEDLYLAYLQRSIEDESRPQDQVLAEFLDAIRWTYSTCSSSCSNLVVALLEWVGAAGDQAVLDRIFARLERAAVPPVLPLAGYKSMIAFKLAEDGGKPSPDRVEAARALYDKAASAYSGLVDLWADFVKFERVHGTVATEKRALLRAMQIVDRAALLVALD